MTKTSKLPPEEVVFLKKLPRKDFESRLKSLWEAGWSLSALGSSIDPERPKTTVHFWVKRAETVPQAREVPLPPPRSLTTSVPTRTAPRTRSISPGVPESMKPRLKSLATLAKQFRSKAPLNSPYRLANDELTAVAATLRGMGVPTAAIAEAAGVSYRAMARRLSK